MSTSSIDKLTVPEKRALLEALCDSLAGHEVELPLSDAQRNLIRDRVAAFRANPKQGTPIDEAVAGIRAARK
ncbi:MAG: addiction module protein [Planctomycetes bacterium]|nr:addiction module protein [Planctomycetota bacterium]